MQIEELHNLRIKYILHEVLNKINLFGVSRILWPQCSCIYDSTFLLPPGAEATVFVLGQKCGFLKWEYGSRNHLRCVLTHCKLDPFFRNTSVL